MVRDRTEVDVSYLWLCIIVSSALQQGCQRPHLRVRIKEACKQNTQLVRRCLHPRTVNWSRGRLMSQLRTVTCARSMRRPCHNHRHLLARRCRRRSVSLLCHSQVALAAAEAAVVPITRLNNVITVTALKRAHRRHWTCMHQTQIHARVTVHTHTTHIHTHSTSDISHRNYLHANTIRKCFNSSPQEDIFKLMSIIQIVPRQIYWQTIVTSKQISWFKHPCPCQHTGQLTQHRAAAVIW